MPSSSPWLKSVGINLRISNPSPLTIKFLNGALNGSLVSSGGINPTAGCILQEQYTVSSGWSSAGVLPVLDARTTHISGESELSLGSSMGSMSTKSHGRSELMTALSIQQSCLRAGAASLSSNLGLHRLIPNNPPGNGRYDNQQHAYNQRRVVYPVSLNVDSGDCVNRYMWLGWFVGGCFWLIWFTVTPGVFLVLSGRRLSGWGLIGVGIVAAIVAGIAGCWGISQPNKCEEYHDQQVFHGEEILTQPSDYKGFRQLLSENKAKPQHLGVGGVK